MNWAIAVDEFFFDVIGLARHAVVTAVNINFDVARVVTSLQQLEHATLVAIFGGANEVVVLHVELLPRVGIQRGDFVDKLAGRLAGGVGVLLYFEPMFVGAGQQMHVVTAQAVPATHGVGHDGGVGMAKVRLGRHIINRGRRRELWHHSNLRSSP